MAVDLDSVEAESLHLVDDDLNDRLLLAARAGLADQSLCELNEGLCVHAESLHLDLDRAS